MAIGIEGPRVWFPNTQFLALRAMDVAALADGRILVGLGGGSGTSAAYATAILNTTTDTLGPLSTETLAPANTGLFAGTTRYLEITPLAGGAAVLTSHMFNADLNGDGNFSLGVQIARSGALPGNPRAVNLDPNENTYDRFETLRLPNGDFLVFFTEPGQGFNNLSNGIRMARFNADGTRDGAIRFAIPDSTSIVQRDPEDPSATLMRNGNIGLVYKDNGDTGSPRVRFQEITETGTRVGPALILDGAEAFQTNIERLSGGNMMAVWSERFTGRLEAQMLTPTGEKLGGVITIAEGAPINVRTDVEALANGRVAVSWYDGALGQRLAQIFSADGKAATNPFAAVVSNGAIQQEGGITARDGQLFAWANVTINFVTQMVGQVWSTAPSMGTQRTFGNGADTFAGTARDDKVQGAGGNDRLSGAAGNDVLTGDAGNDTLSGGDAFDFLYGGDGNDVLTGGGGGGVMLGGAGTDRLTGGIGNDILRGGIGVDTLTGGAGADRFLFGSVLDYGDRITDFDAAEGDKIAWSFVRIIPGFPINDTNNNPTNVGLHFNTATKRLTYDPDGAGGFQPRVLIAIVEGADQLTFSDFLIT